MNEIETLPISAALGDRNVDVQVEESWSKDVPASMGANAPVEELNRSKLIAEALKHKSARRSPEPTINPQPYHGGPARPVLSVIAPSTQHHFFVVDGRKLTFIGSKEIDVSKFQKDLSGRFFREWLKKNFPGRRDYDDICVWNDATPLKEITDLLGMAE
jgi:hypothetical protein